MVVVMRFMRCELRKGCTFIGALWLVFSVPFIVGGPLTMRMFEEIKEEEYRNFPGTLTPEMMHIAFLTMTVFRTCFYGITTIAVADAIFSTMLIIGAQKEKRALVLSWLAAQLCLMPIWVLLVMAFVVLSFFSGHMLVGSLTVLVVGLRIGVTMYCTLVVHGLYEYLRRHQSPSNTIRAV